MMQTAPSPVARVPAEEYQIQIGDQLDIKFFYNPTLNEQVIVRPDGRISLQLVQEIAAAGLSPASLTRELSARYAVELRQPELTVIVRGFGGQHVFVDGEVARPGLITILASTTALQAIAQAGGLKESARESQVLIIRRTDADQPEALQIDLRKAQDGSNIAVDVALQPFDIVFVPRSRVANVNLWVDQYVRKNVPFPLGFQYGLFR
jgi:protein involved in polysaccharide export with SLBB domain